MIVPFFVVKRQTDSLEFGRTATNMMLPTLSKFLFSTTIGHMSSSAPTKRLHATNTLSTRKGVLDWLRPFLTTTVGMKVTTGLTGAALTGFVIVHLIGNLKLFAGQEGINSYAHFLKDLGPFLWVARAGLLAIFGLHLYLAVTLSRRSMGARPIPYAYPATIQASVASRTMLWTGIVILLFVLFHLAHYTFGVVGTTKAYDLSTGSTVNANYLDLVDENGNHDVYSMVVAGFRQPLISVLYLLAQLALLVHLSHGIGSVFQTLGFNTPRTQPFVSIVSKSLAFLLVAGNIAIVVAVWAGYLPEVKKFVL